MVVWRLLEAPRRYRDLEALLDGVTQRVLTQALRELKEDGVILKSNGYWSLTESGENLATAMRGMFDWGTAHAAAFPSRQ